MNDVLNKKVLAEKVADLLNTTKKEGAEVVDMIFDEMANTLKDGGKIDISGFGKIEVKEKAAHVGINPATKEKINVAAKKGIKFRPSKPLKELVK